MPTPEELKDTVEALLQKKQYPKAYKILMFLAKNDPQDFDVRLRLAETCVALRCEQDAIKIYKHLAARFLQKGHLPQAISINKRILELDPRDTEIKTRLEELYSKGSKPANSNQWEMAKKQARKRVDEIAQQKLEMPVESLELAGPGDKVTATVSEMVAQRSGPGMSLGEVDSPSGLEIAGEDDRESLRACVAGSCANERGR